MQRDPLGVNPFINFSHQYNIDDQYIDGYNLYVYVGNNVVNHNDAFGLCHFTDEGQKPPRRITKGPARGNDIAGETLRKVHELKLKIEKCQAPCLWRVVIRTARCSGTYWWAYQNSRAHEMDPVSIFQNGWSAELAQVKRFRLQCVPKKKAKCYLSAAELWAAAEELQQMANQVALEAARRAQILGPNHPETQYWQNQINSSQNTANNARTKAQNKEDQCSKM